MNVVRLHEDLRNKYFFLDIKCFEKRIRKFYNISLCRNESEEICISISLFAAMFYYRYYPLTLSQTTNFRLLKTHRVCR